ncbi:DUF317 domain-containing protein [Streptomyces sp. NPDC002104]
MNEDLKAFAEDQNSKLHCEISPRHLAGAGDPRHATHVLRAAGWKHSGDRGLPHVRLTSPDRSLSLSIEPSAASFPPWWRLGTHPFTPGYWTARFDGNTPVEIIAGLTDSLTRPAPEQQSPDAWETLAAAGWNVISNEPHRGEADAPHPGLRIRQRGLGSPDDGRFWWSVEATTENGGGGVERIWSASLDRSTPPRALEGFLAELVNPAPVLRGSHDNTRHYLAVEGEPFAAGAQIVAAHEVRVAAAKAAGRALARGPERLPSAVHPPVRATTSTPSGRTR